MSNKKQKIISLFAAIIIIFTTVASSTYIIINAEHSCDGGNCAVCTSLYLAEKTINQFSSGSVVSQVTVAGFFVTFILVVVFYFLKCSYKTPVSSNIRLNE